MTAAPSRRTLLRTVAAAGGGAAATAFLASCAADGGSGSSAEGPPVTLKITEVPVGGGVVLTAEQIVVTQPTAGEFHAFSAICTHQRCPVSSVEDAGVYCACHSSYFDIATGAPLSGPARTPLPSMQVEVQGETLSIGGAQS